MKVQRDAEFARRPNKREVSQAAYEGSIPFARSKPQTPIDARHFGFPQSVSVLLAAGAGRKQDVDCGKVRRVRRESVSTGC